MKIGIIGVGNVGKACAMACVMRGVARDIVLLDKNKALAKAVATDLQYGAPLSSPLVVREGGYEALQDAALVMVTAGLNEKTGGATDRNDPQGRLKLLGANKKIYADIIPQVVKAAPDAIILIVTDPPDPLADVARGLAGHDKVISTGTYLDTLRFRFHLAQAFHVNPLDVDAWVIGEHGTSSVFLWSSVMIGGKPVQADKGLQKQITEAVKFANITIIEGNDASQYGIGMVCARITEVIGRNEKAVIPVGVYHQDYGVTLSLPSVVGAGGVQAVLMPTLSPEEIQALEACVKVLKAAQ